MLFFSMPFFLTSKFQRKILNASFGIFKWDLKSDLGHTIYYFRVQKLFSALFFHWLIKIIAFLIMTKFHQVDYWKLCIVKIFVSGFTNSFKKVYVKILFFGLYLFSLDTFKWPAPSGSKVKSLFQVFFIKNDFDDTFSFQKISIISFRSDYS